MKMLCVACFTLFFGPLASAADMPPSADEFNLHGYSLESQNKYDQALAASPPRGSA